MPYSVIEAMATGLPVIATDVGDVAKLLAPSIAEECMVPVGDEARYADRLRWLASDGDARDRIGRANQAFARASFGIDKMLEAYDRLFQSHLAR